MHPMHGAFLSLALAACPVILQGQLAVGFIENRGQWPAAVSHMAEQPGALVWCEPGSILIDRYDQAAMQAIAHAHVAEEPSHVPATIDHHALRLRFAGADPSPRMESIGVKPGTYNYLIGNDPSHWGEQCHAFSAVLQRDMLPGIDLRLRSNAHGVKYDLILHPGSYPDRIQFRYEGADHIVFDPEQLTIRTSLGDVTETIPVAYQEIDGIKTIIPCRFRELQDGFGFEIGTYDRAHDLTIDPLLIFSTYSGSVSNNFGYTATFDRDGFLYSGSSAFGPQYPVTIGAYQVVHAGGDGSYDGIDMALTKYDTTGTQRIWSTYLGGSSDELPHSLVVNQNDELFVFGTSSSADFPTTSDAFDNSFNGGSSLDLRPGLGAFYPNGVDIVLARLSADGGDLLAATFIGGSANDGMNTAQGLKYNYADEVRGEILLDENDNVFVTTTTSSTDFPTTANAAQATYAGGSHDGVLLKMDASLTTLIWSTYLGGSEADALYNLELDENGGIYVAGGTRSPNLPVTPGALHTTFLGGSADGFVADVSTDGSTVLACTYFGSAAYDQCYFADLDQNGDIYLFGQTQAPSGALVLDAAYNEPNAGQFITKVDPALSTILLSTRFGQGDGQPDISPTAFLVDYCDKIYVSGWGGEVQSTILSTAGLDVTSDAFQLTTDSNDFYMAVFEIDLSALYYATYFGGAISNEHVDGGTSRFDRRGRVYQSMCAGCGGNSDLPIFPSNAVSPTNNSGLCNNAVFKFDLDIPMVVADFSVNADCLPDPVAFNNNSFGASGYQWDFGDGTTSTVPEPAHIYPNTGVYTVRLIATNPAACNVNDTTYRQVVVLGQESIDLPDTSICAGRSIQIGILPIVGSGITYQWSPTTGLSDASVANPIAAPLTATTYTLTISNGTCSTTAQQSIAISEPLLDAGPDQTICGPVATAILRANGFGTINSFQWSSDPGFTDMLNTSAQDSTAIVQVTEDSWFYVRQTDNGCGGIDSVFIRVPLSGIGLEPVEAICTGDTGIIFLTGTERTYEIVWSPEEYITTGQGTERIRARAPTTTTFSVVVTTPEGCTWNGSTPLVVSSLTASSIQATAVPTVLVSGGSVQLQAFPAGLNYAWTPASVLDDPFIEAPVGTIQSTTLFTVSVSDGICFKDASVLVEVRELLCEGPDIFVPNTFTPNGDGRNDVLFVRGRNITDLEFLVFDRWGEKVFETIDINRGWDGTFEGKPVDPAVFVYHLTAFCVDGQRYFTKGNVTVVR